MQFTPAHILKNLFNVYGHFYQFRIENKTFDCRSRLDIISTESARTIDQPQAIFVLMNPGSSKPIDENFNPVRYTFDDTARLLDPPTVLARPDSAQYQIMRLMLDQNWNHTRIINLCDVQNGNSLTFNKTLKFLQRKKRRFPYSIVDPKRQVELESHLYSGHPKIIGAWGSMPLLRPIAQHFLTTYPETIALKKANYGDVKFASPMLQKHKKEWLLEISAILK